MLPTTGTVAGTYTWHVSYVGDANNNSAVDQGGTADQTIVSKANPTLVSTASPAITLGTTAPTLSDSVVLAGGYYETGNAIFTLTGPGGFSYTQSDKLSGNGVYTASSTLPTTGTVAGTYTWHVSYAGDANNNSAIDQGGAAEQTVVSKANPTLVSTASPAITLGTTAPTLTDSVVLAGGYYETGSVVFTLIGPGGFSYTKSDALTGNGTYTASQTLPSTATFVGTYTWQVSYVGDANNNSAVDQGGTAEQTPILLPAQAAYVLNATASGAVNASGNATVQLPGGLYVDSSSASCDPGQRQRPGQRRRHRAGRRRRQQERQRVRHQDRHAPVHQRPARLAAPAQRGGPHQLRGGQRRGQQLPDALLRASTRRSRFPATPA